MNEELCDICGKVLETQSKRQVGLLLRVEPGSLEYKDFTKMFGKRELKACYCCFAKGIGFKQVGESKCT